MKNNSCSLCFAVNRKSYNIINTHLQPVLEKFINSKIQNVSSYSLCFICHTRLQQSYQLWQLAKETECLLQKYLTDKSNEKIEHKKCLLELSISNVINISIMSECIGDVKQESILTEDIHEDDLANHKDITDELIIGNEEVKCTPNMSLDIKEDPLEVISTKEDISDIGDEIEIEIKLEDYRGPERDIEDFGGGEDTSVHLNADSEDIPVRGVRCEQDFQNTGAEDKNMVLENCNEFRLQSNNADFIISKKKNKDMDSKLFSCGTCQSKFIHKDTLKHHILRSHVDKPFCCHICQRTFPYQYLLRRHGKSHTGYKPYSCDICKRNFSLRTSLKTHIKTHTGDKPFRCDICQRKFSRKCILKAHMRTHTGDKPFSCNICKRNFSQQSSLNAHIRTHTGEKPFSCDICHRSFSQPHILKDHKRTHTGEKPYSCHICHLNFSYRYLLKTHTRTHTG